METITIQTARQVMLAAQGLDQPPERRATRAAVLKSIRRMHLLQIDTIHVVMRSPYLVLWSRLGDYEPRWLEELLAKGALFEYWSHAMCFLPIEDYPLYRRRMLDAVEATTWPVKWAVKWSRENAALVDRIRSHIRGNGAVRSADFENKNHRSGGWWDWKEEKDALEALFLVGEIMIARREKFQRLYDLRERVLPGVDDSSLPSSEEMRRTLALRAVSALGVAFPLWAAAYFQQPRKGFPGRLEALAAEGLLRQVHVEGFDRPAYVHPERLGLLKKAASGKLAPSLTALLSPFDPLVSDRQRARELFDFDYTIECYTPAAKRRYGYFNMPILHRGRLVGRLDPKAHRKEGLFEIKSLHLEPGVKITPELTSDLADVLRRLAAWHGTPDVVIRQSDPPGFARRLQAAL